MGLPGGVPNDDFQLDLQFLHYVYVAFVYSITIYRFYDNKIIINNPFRLSSTNYSYNIIDIKEVLYAKNIYSDDHIKITFNSGEVKRHYFLHSIFNSNYADLKTFLKDEEIPFFRHERFKENSVID